jgi:hypothetical protein
MNNIKEIDGNLLDFFDQYNIAIAHVCNCKGVMGAGLAHSIKIRYPSAYNNYKSYELLHGLTLGTISTAWVDSYPIINLHAQLNYGYVKKQYLDYDSLRECLNKTQKLLLENNITEIGLPYKMGSDRAGGDWNIVLGIISEELNKLNVTIVKL